MLDRYLARVHEALRGEAIDSEDVERDVRDHVKMALADRRQPVSPAELSQVLEDLGSPADWLSAGAAPTERNGEGWRLAYLSLLLILLGLALPPFLWIGVLGAFVAARASLCVLGQRRGEYGPHWLVLPSLLIVYVPTVLFGLLWPAMAVRLLADAILAGGALSSLVPWDLHALAERIAAIRLSSFDPVETTRHAIRSGHYLLGPVGCWLVVLGLVARAWPRPFAWLFRPLLREGSTAAAQALILGGAVLTCFSFAIGALKVLMSQAGIV